MGKNIEIYVDDMVVKSKVVSEHLRDLDSTFGVLRKHKLRLNASKCQASFWAIWLTIGESRLALTRSRP